MKTNLLSERRKADRAKMAEGLVALAREVGARAEIIEMTPTLVWVAIQAAHGLELTVEFDGQSVQPDVHVLSWHMASNVDTRFADAFTRAGRLTLNTVHFSKATDIAHGYADLCETLRASLELAASGRAFDEEREAKFIARNGATAAERISRLKGLYGVPAAEIGNDVGWEVVP